MLFYDNLNFVFIKTPNIVFIIRDRLLNISILLWLRFHMTAGRKYFTWKSSIPHSCNNGGTISRILACCESLVEGVGIQHEGVILTDVENIQLKEKHLKLITV